MFYFSNQSKQYMSSKFLRLISILLFFSSASTSLSQNCGNISLSDIASIGPYDYETINQNDGLRDGPDYGNATVYYPLSKTLPSAAVAIVPGFVSTQNSVATWGPFLASHGIVTIIIDTNSLFDPPSARADGLIDALETLRQENTRVDSPLFDHIDTDRFAVMGWSMGGGAAQLAASIDPNIKAVIALCPWLSFPVSSDLNHSVPVLILSGQLDPTAPPSLHANVHYNLTPDTTDKLLFELASGNHSIANNPANVQGEIGEYGLAWLRYYLLGDTCHCTLALEPSTSTSQNATNVTCPSAITCPSQMTLFNNQIADGHYQAIQTVLTQSIIPTGGMLSFQAEQNIYLGIGFSADLGAEFEAKIQACQ